MGEHQGHATKGQGHSSDSRSQVSEDKIPVFIMNVDICSPWVFSISLNFFFFLILHSIFCLDYTLSFLATTEIWVQRQMSHLPHPSPDPVLHTEGMHPTL